jgi:hypothetical protein
MANGINPTTAPGRLSEIFDLFKNDKFFAGLD